MTPIGLALCILTTICWAIAPILLRKSLDTFDNTEINAARSVGAIVTSALLCVIFSPSSFVWEYGLNALGVVFSTMILGNFAGDICYMIAIHNIGVGRALSTANSYPVFVTLFSVYWLGEAPSLMLLAGTAIIIAGLTFLNCSRKSSVPPSKKVRSNALGFFMALLTSVMWALSHTIQKWALVTYNFEALTVTLWRGILLAFTAWGFWYFRKNGTERKHIFNVGFKKWLSPCLAGTFGFVVGGIAFTLALKTTPVSLASPITATNPVIAAMTARFAFNEHLSPVQWLGIFMVIIGGVVVSS